MTLEEFLARLRETPRRWYFHQGNFYRPIFCPNYTMPSSHPARWTKHCPVSAVAGDDFSIETWPKAAIHLGLPRDLALKIVGASIFGIGWPRRKGAARRDLFEKIVDACGLSGG